MSCKQSVINITEIQINGLTGHIVTDDPFPTFTVMVEGGEGCCIEDIRAEVFKADGLQIWDNGKRKFAIPHIYYQGPELEPKTVYSLTITLYDKNGSTVHDTTNFETGLMKEGWKAGWIEPIQESAIHEKGIAFDEIFIPHSDYFGGHVRLHPCREIQKKFEYSSLPERARIYASAHGVYELLVNGVKAGKNILPPEISSYKQRLYYQTYDVTGLIKKGENNISVTLADGWWIGRIGLSGDSCQFGERLGFIMQLEIKSKDGDKQIICSDESFECRRSYIDYADLFIGERHNYTAQREKWKKCERAEYNMENLVAQPIAPIVSINSLQPKEYMITPKGELVVDFGQVIAGVVQITVRSKKNEEVTLDFSETLDKEGNFFRNIIGRNKDQRDIFVCGEGETTFKAKFTYHGFRYIRIIGIEKKQIVKLEAVAMGTDIKERGYFECSDERLNRLQKNIVWSARSNMFSVPTDCPQREKMGWTGDIQVFVKTACFNFDMYNFLSAWLDNMRTEQLPSGEVPNIVPSYPVQDKMQRSGGDDNTSAAWGDACVLVPYYLYQYYGNKRVLKENFNMMEHWLGYIKNQSSVYIKDPAEEKSDHYKYLWRSGHHFGDWLIPSFRNKPNGVEEGRLATYEVVASCFYALTVRIFILVLDALIENSEKSSALHSKKAYYKDLLAKIIKAVKTEYISKNGRIKGDLQGLYVLALYAGIADGELKSKLVKRLVELIEQNDNRLDTGFVSTQYLLDVLYDNGYKETAYKLLFQTKAPSWLYQVEKGATTIWENWEAIKPDGTVTNSSFNHYAYGCVGDWIYRHIGGVNIGGPGYSKIVFAPDINCGLEYSNCYVQTAYGKAECNWSWQDDICNIEIQVPINTKAEFIINGYKKSLESGRHRFTFSRKTTYR